MLLYAVKDLFPHAISELNVLVKRLESEFVYELPDDDPINVKAQTELSNGVAEWTRRHRISSPAVDEAAERYATRQGQGVSAGVLLIDWPSIEVRPYYETRAGFKRRAGEFFDSVVRDFMARYGDKFGPVKYADSEHFRCLAAYLVGDYGWADIAGGKTGLDVRVGDQRAIAAGAKQVAKTLMIQMSRRRGRPKGRVRK